MYKHFYIILINIIILVLMYKHIYVILINIIIIYIIEVSMIIPYDFYSTIVIHVDD